MPPPGRRWSGSSSCKGALHLQKICDAEAPVTAEVGSCQLPGGKLCLPQQVRFYKVGIPWVKYPIPGAITGDFCRVVAGNGQRRHQQQRRKHGSEFHNRPLSFAEVSPPLWNKIPAKPRETGRNSKKTWSMHHSMLHISQPGNGRLKSLPQEFRTYHQKKTDSSTPCLRHSAQNDRKRTGCLHTACHSEQA